MNVIARLAHFCRPRFFMTAIGLVFAFAVTGNAQDEDYKAQRLKLLERIRIESDSVFILDGTAAVLDDVNRLLSDFGLSGLREMVKDLIPFSRSNDWMAPGTAASDLFGGTYQFYVKSPDEFAKSLGADPQALKSGLLSREAFERLLERDGNRHNFNQHRIEANELFLRESYRLDGKRDSGRRDRLKIDSELLWPTLDKRTREIVLQSGIAVVSLYEQTDLHPYYEKELELLLQEVAGSEREWLSEVNKLFQASDRQVLGLRYHPRLMEMQARLQLRKGKSFDHLIQPNSGAENWRPDLGLERERLVIASAIQMNAFPNSAAARTAPKIGLVFGEQQFQWLNGNMLKVLMELIGDSWNDLEAGRIALYENEKSEKAGCFSIIGVADSRDPAGVLRELERMSQLTSPEVAAVKGRERDEEIARLIRELLKSDENAVNRAQTRLVLAGRAAIPQLRQAAESGHEELKKMVTRILSQVDRADLAVEQKFGVSDPGFWTALNPGLRFEKHTGKIAGFQTHVVHITPDPSKSEKEVADAVELMENLFGPTWHTIHVVEVGTHFVFMIGSDQALLERIAKRVSQATCELSKDLEGKGNCNRHGQLQVWVHGYRFVNLARPDMVRFRKDLPQEVKTCLQPLWAGAEFNGAGMEIKSLVPIEQLRGVVGF